MVVVLVMVMVMFQLSHATIYKVGDSVGWTITGNVDYKQWAATKNFQVGDIIIFEYDSRLHDVNRVNHAMYRACNISAPFATFTTGNDLINITTRGHHYFLCGVPGHCQLGLKVDINVIPTSEMSQPSSFKPPSSYIPALSSLAPSPNNADSFKGKLVDLTTLIISYFVYSI
ncbi:mavicyanin-like [Carica papaya]|uniref:mavicyanin-like n=1 Tax=Carica papaya TaxID=3649 RepID=UPI000B8CF463|nr:mavicyanin-like [Carica papaya]